MKILITGNKGFIGTHLERKLIERGHEIVGMSEGDMVECGISDQEFDLVYHLAAKTNYDDKPSYLWLENVLLVAELMEAIKTPRVIYASSQAVYGEYPYPGGLGGSFSEADYEDVPESAYGLSKLHGEQVAHLIGNRRGIEVVSLRYSIVLGPGQRYTTPYAGVLRNFVHAVMNGYRPMIFDDGKQTRDFVHIDDVTYANILAMSLPEGVYNVGGGVPYTILELCNEVLSTSSASVEPQFADCVRIGDPRHIISDISKIKEHGWEPTKNLKDMVKDYIDWIRKAGCTITTDPAEELEKAIEAGHVKRI